MVGADLFGAGLRPAESRNATSSGEGHLWARSLNSPDFTDATVVGPTEDHVSPVSEAAAAEIPVRIDRYRVDKRLGAGGFGHVYLAHDEQLQRSVAIKVPAPQLVSRPEDVQAYLAEARVVASL